MEIDFEDSAMAEEFMGQHHRQRISSPAHPQSFSSPPTQDGERGPIVGLFAGSFDLCHAGHVQALAFAKQYCDEVIAALQVDASKERLDKRRPVQSMFERWLQLKSCRFVDEIIPYEDETDLYNLLATLNINIRFIGADWYNKDITCQDICKVRNIQIMWVPRYHSYSTTELRARVCDMK